MRAKIDISDPWLDPVMDALRGDVTAWSPAAANVRLDSEVAWGGKQHRHARLTPRHVGSKLHPGPAPIPVNIWFESEVADAPVANERFATGSVTLGLSEGFETRVARAVSESFGDDCVLAAVTDDEGGVFKSISCHLDSMVLRFVEERGEAFLDLALGSNPGRFFFFDDLSVALGWESTGSVLARVRPRPLEEAIQHLARNRAELADRFSTNHAAATLNALEAAAAARAGAVAARLR